LITLPFGALLLVIVEMVGEKIRRKRYERQRAEIERWIHENRIALGWTREKERSMGKQRRKFETEFKPQIIQEGESGLLSVGAGRA